MHTLARCYRFEAVQYNLEAFRAEKRRREMQTHFLTVIYWRAYSDYSAACRSAVFKSFGVNCLTFKFAWLRKAWKWHGVARVLLLPQSHAGVHFCHDRCVLWRLYPKAAHKTYNCHLPDQVVRKSNTAVNIYKLSGRTNYSILQADPSLFADTLLPCKWVPGLWEKTGYARTQRCCPAGCACLSTMHRALGHTRAELVPVSLRVRLRQPAAGGEG